MINLTSFLNGDVETIAKRLLGCELERQVNDKILRVKIIEVEAYDETDPASHSYNGPTTRTNVMFEMAGKLYVYFIYGMHYCANIVVGQEGQGAAVLIRAVKAIEGEAMMQHLRGRINSKNLLNGPAKVCQALRIDKTMNGHCLVKAPLKLIICPEIAADRILVTSRIGVSKSKNKLRRFVIKQ